MWCDELQPDQPWSSLWSGYIRCAECLGIRTLENLCPVCSARLPDDEETVVEFEDGEEHIFPPCYQGAETRYEDYVYLQLMEREWKRTLRDGVEDDASLFTRETSAGASIVLLFWTYFETRVEHLLRDGLRDIPPRFLDDALKRYSFIGARLVRFYNIAFDSSYFDDLNALGFEDVSKHLSKVQKQRNSFVHGTPQGIDDSLVSSVVEMLKREHEAWIAVYNLRATDAL